MRHAVDQLIEYIRFAGVAVAFVGVVITVVRAAVASLGGGGQRVTEVGLDLARIVLVAVDLLLVGAILEVAIDANEITFRRLATVAGLRIGLTLLIAFEDAYRSDTGAGRSGVARRWSRGLGLARRPDPRPRGVEPVERRSGENVWADRARLGREGDWQRSTG